MLYSMGAIVVITVMTFKTKVTSHNFLLQSRAPHCFAVGPSTTLLGDPKSLLCLHLVLSQDPGR